MAAEIPGLELQAVDSSFRDNKPCLRGSDDSEDAPDASGISGPKQTATAQFG